MWILLPTLIVLHVIVCFFLALIVMMQRPKSEGLGAAFGSGMTENLFGAQTTNVLTRFTVWLGAAFFILSLALAVIYAKSSGGSSIYFSHKDLLESTKAAKAAAVAPSATASPAASAVPAAPQASPSANP